jgi:1-acyl-sn-glycerol-3-phosphate acyltransferase
MVAPLRHGSFSGQSPGRPWRPGVTVLTTPIPALPGWHCRFLCRLILFFFSPLLEVEDADRLANLEGPVIFACNHSNSVEAILVPTLLAFLRGGERVHFLADWMFLHLPPFGWLLQMGGVIPVYRKRARWGLRDGLRQRHRHESPLAAGLALLAAGKCVGIFPEGTRNADPEHLLRGRSGVGALALQSGAPVVPIGIRYPAAARLGRPPKLGRLVVCPGETLHFSPPAPLAGPGGPAPAVSKLDRWPLRRATEKVMASLAQLSGKREPHRQSEVA